MNLSINHLQTQYRLGLTPTDLVKQLAAAISEDSHHAWIYRLSVDEMLVYAKNLEGKEPKNLPLYGIPFAIKDNIDFNERLAVFVANKGTEQFYLEKEGANAPRPPEETSESVPEESPAPSDKPEAGTTP